MSVGILVILYCYIFPMQENGLFVIIIMFISFMVVALKMVTMKQVCLTLLIFKLGNVDFNVHSRSDNWYVFVTIYTPQINLVR